MLVSNKLIEMNSSNIGSNDQKEAVGYNLNKIATGSFTGEKSNTKVKNQGELNKEDFMMLLVAELQNQNPLEPKSNQEMGSSLAQFSQLDQLESMNQNIAKMARAKDPSNKLYSASLIGKNVKTESVNIHHEKGDLQDLSFSVNEMPDKAEIKIYDNSGNEVRNINLDNLNTGVNYYKWDGKSANGDYLPSGVYTYEVKASNIHGASIKVERGVSGLVSSVEYSDDKVALILNNGNKVKLEDVKYVNSSYKGASND